MEERISLSTRLSRAFATLTFAALVGACATGPADRSGRGPAAPVEAATTPVPAPAASAPVPAVAATGTNSADATIATPAPAQGDEAASRPIDPLSPSTAPIDPRDTSARVDLWERIRKGFAIPDLDVPLVRNHERFYASQPDYVARMTGRASLYLFHIVEEVERRNMPTELALLPFIESAFNPQAMSVARASGMWQFIPSTGKHYDLQQNLFRDDRRDVLASTRAALDYLTRLYGMFGDWQLALAAYNWGEGSVQRAVAHNQRRGEPTDYLSLRMPNETRNYLPKLQAVKNIVRDPQSFALTLPDLQNHPYFLSVPIERDIDVALAAKLAQLPIDDFKMLNPQLNQPVVLAAGTPQILLPYDNANEFVRAVNKHRGPLASWTAYVAKKTMKPAELAKQVGMTEEELREVNRIPPHVSVKAGSTLIVPRGDRLNENVATHIADNAMIAFVSDAPPAKRTTVRVGKGGASVDAIAKRYRATPAQVAQWNNVAPNAHFRAGQTVVLYVAQTARAAVATTRAKATARPTRSVSAKRPRRG